MITFELRKKPPRQFVYVLSKKDFRKSCRICEKDTISLRVIFSGTASEYERPDSKPNRSLRIATCGSAKGRRMAGKWQIDVEMLAQPRTSVDPWRDQIKQILLEDLENWLGKLLCEGLADLREERQLFLQYRFVGAGVASASFEPRTRW